MNRLGWLDVLRGLAACAVALFHFNELPVSGPQPAWMEAWKNCWKFGHAGVPVFFVLSGYCIGATALRAPSVGDFLARRAWRIFPGYWASLACIVVLALARRAWVGVNDLAVLPRTVSEWLLTLVLGTAPLTDVKTINWVYWSLSFELAFYALVALALCFRQFRRVTALTVIALTTILIGIYFAPASGPFFFLRLWPLFALGLVPLLASKQPAAASLIGAGCALFFGVEALRGRELLYPAVGLSTTLLIVVCLRWQTPAPRGLRLVGEWSYSIYLLHVPLACYAVRWITGPPSGPWADLALQGLQLAVTLAAGACAYRWFERPFLASGATSPVADPPPVPLEPRT